MSALPSANDFAINLEPRIACVLLLDRSSSMSGAKIDQLNAGVQLLCDELKKDEVARLRVELAIISFGGSVTTDLDFQTVTMAIPPYLTAGGDTPMGQAIRLGIEAIAARKATYKANGVPYYRPWLFLLTDGEPNDLGWEMQAVAVHDGTAAKRFEFFAVGVDGADFTTLRQIASPARPPLQMNGLQFGSLFQWLSVSLSQVSRSSPGAGGLNLTPPGWGTVST
jgi:uncharacterized protein YegL